MLPLTTTFRSMNVADRTRSLEYISLCREHFLAFARYGSKRTREMLHEDSGIAQDQRAGAWRTERIFDAWLTYERGRLGNETAEVEGWIPEKNETQGAGANNLPAVDGGGPERARLLAEDGVTDPRNEWTELDAQFIIQFDFSALPTAFQAMAAPDRVRPTTSSVAETRMRLNYEVIDELDGRAPLPVKL